MVSATARSLTAASPTTATARTTCCTPPSSLQPRVRRVTLSRRYDPEGGIGLFPYLLDSHHAERGRQGRFIRLLSDTVRQPNGSTIGLGIDQNTSAIYTPSSPIVVISGGAAGAGAWHYDVSGARAVRSSKGWSVSNVVVSYATNGDSLNLRTGQVFPAAWKTPLAGNEQVCFIGNRFCRVQLVTCPAALQCFRIRRRVQLPVSAPLKPPRLSVCFATNVSLSRNSRDPHTHQVRHSPGDRTSVQGSCHTAL